MNEPTAAIDLDQVVCNYLSVIDAGTAPSRDDLVASFPHLADELRDFFDAEDQAERATAPLRTSRCREWLACQEDQQPGRGELQLRP